jgi:hypothetical protein
MVSNGQAEEAAQQTGLAAALAASQGLLQQQVNGTSKTQPLPSHEKIVRICRIGRH